jgi:hypothetical protein
MAMARQVATLLLDLYDIRPDYSRAIPNDWYRQALDYRVPRGEGPSLRAALGGIERSQFSRIQALLRLSDPVWELATAIAWKNGAACSGRGSLTASTRAVVIEKNSRRARQQLVESGICAHFSRRDKPRV